MTGARRFQAFNVGLPKTGTTSVAGLFSRYRTYHEFMFLETGQAITEWVSGALSDQQLKLFLQDRDRRGHLEMDSSSFNFHYAHILSEIFPEARFLLTLRDCYSWLDSLFNLTLHIGKDMADAAVTYGQQSFGIQMTKEMISSRSAFLEHITSYMDGFMRLYTRANTHVIEHLPAGRSLIVRTHELGASIEKLAALVGVPPETIRHEQSHLFPARTRFDILRDLDPQWLEDLVAEHCRPVMEEFFSGYRLRDFLEGRKPV